MKSLHRALLDYDMAMLRALAHSRGLMLASNRQSEAVNQLAVALADPLSVRAALAMLSPDGRRALEALQAAGGRMRAGHFAREFGRVQPSGPGRLEREALWQNPANATEELWYSGLIYRAFLEDAAGEGEFIFIPEDLRSALPLAIDGPPPFSLQVVPVPWDLEGAQHAAPPQAALVQDLFAFLVYLQTHDARACADSPIASGRREGTRGRLSQRDLEALLVRLTDCAADRLEFLQHLAGGLGFVARQAEYLRLEAATAKKWLSASPARQLRALQEGWRDDPAWVDLCQIPELVCDPETGWQLRYDPIAVRQAFLPLLARCPLDSWWILDSFVHAIRAFDPDFQRPDGDYGSWYIRDLASGAYLAGFEAWDRVEGALIRYLVTGPLRWLGVVAVAPPPPGLQPQGAAHASGGEAPGPGDLLLCRLTDDGARFLGLMADEPEPPPAPSLVVHADSCVDVAATDLYTRFQLERFADPERSDPSLGFAGGLCRYRLGVEPLGRALARGIRVEQVLAFLRQASAAPLPANVVDQLRAWAGRFGQLELEEVVLLRVQNERVLRELNAHPQIRPLLGQALSPTLILVDKRNIPRLRKELAALGYLASQEP